MGYDPVTPFRRAIDAAHLERRRYEKRDLPVGGVNKWDALRALSAARQRIGLSDRDLTVLQALLSFHNGLILGAEPLVVHPSNRTICERLNGMPCSTMRRHLANLVLAGVITRRDSPNGKRYVRRAGDERSAFGFDLKPLASRFEEFCHLADACRAKQQEVARLRETASLMRRDLLGLSAYGQASRPDLTIWASLTDLAVQSARTLRRNLDLADLHGLLASLAHAVTEASDILEPGETEDLGTNARQIEQHHQSSQTDLSYIESGNETAESVKLQVVPSRQQKGREAVSPENRHLPVTLGVVLSCCPEIASYADGDIRHWHEFVQTADRVRPMMGVSASAWDDAKRIMGAQQAAVVLAAILERLSSIHSPGGYLRRLAVKASEGAFSPGPMITALLRKAAA